MILLLSVTCLAADKDLRLVEAAKNHDTKAIRALLNQRVDVNTPQPDGATPLLWAAQWDDLETAGLLIQAGARVDADNGYGVTPLSMACTNGSARMVDKLLKAGANPNAALPTGESPLMTAALTGTLEVVKALLAHGSDVNARERIGEQTALMWALSEQHWDVAQTLIEHGADVRARSITGFTPIMFAARQGNVEAVKMLLAQGAEVSDTAADGTTVLHVATVRGHVALAEFLVDHGANPNADGPGYTALHWAAGTWESITAHDYQVESGEWSVLEGLPTRESKRELIKALLSRGANVNARLTKSPPRFGLSLSSVRGGGSVIGATPFFLAAMVGDVEIMRLLVENGADPGLLTKDNTTPLMVAAGIARIEQETHVLERSHLDAVTLCLELGADINAANNAGNSALHATAFAGFDTVARLLVESGATLNAKNKKGETPLKLAEGALTGGLETIWESTADVLRQLGGTK
jgi:ankyrin repeat protein